MKKVLGVILAMSLLFSLFGCGTNSSNNNTSSTQSAIDSNVINDSEHKVGYQLDLPANGEQIAIMKTNMGDFKIRFFPEAAPKAVENFITHSKQGYYNGLAFHRVINDFMIQGGDPLGNGTGGESIWKTPFEDEFSNKLFNIRGALAMANSGKNTNGSQFFINQATAKSFSGWNYYESSYASYKTNPDLFTQTYGGTINMDLVTDEIKSLYKTNGGNPHLDGALNTKHSGHTVFGQVFEGMDIVDKIAAVEVDGNDRPKSDVIIKSIEVTTYNK